MKLFVQLSSYFLINYSTLIFAVDISMVYYGFLSVQMINNKGWTPVTIYS